jgi:glucosylceramidase
VAITDRRGSIAAIAFALFVAGCASSGKSGSAGTGGTTGSGGGSPNPCSAGQMRCGDSCADVLRDPSNCGGCGIPCSNGQACSNGTCACQSGLFCNGACVSSDAAHCGDCTTTCSTDQVCSNNQCTSSCAAGQMLCGTGCVVTNGSDALNCGTCGHACTATQRCDTGTCVDSTTTGSGGSTGAGGVGATGGGTGMAGTTGSGGGPGGAPAGQTTLVTSGPSGYWQTNAQLTTVTSGNATVTVNDTSLAQTWEGFGGAFNEKGWAALAALSDADRTMAMHLLYGTDGARFNLGRIPMGASDYSLSRYTLDEVTSGNDYDMTSFAITRDMQNLIPYIKAAQAVNGGIRFWASPWTPPTWMKTGPYQSGGTTSPFDGGSMTDNAQILAAHAQYFVKFVQAYGQQGITIESVAPQNEPNYGENYPSCVWAASLFTKFVGQYLGPALTAANLPTKIMLGTMSNNSSTADAAIVTNVMNDATAKKYIKVLGYQWTMKDHVASAKSYNLPIWQTEHQCGNYPWASGYKSTAPNDQAYGVESWGLIRDWIKAGVTAYSAWNMVLDTTGLSIDSRQPWAQNALLTVDTAAKKLNLTPTYYVFRHFSQFVAPGAQVVGTTGGDAVAFKNRDGSIVTVMYNSGGATTYTLSVGGKKLQFPMPATGWATVNYVP